MEKVSRELKKEQAVKLMEKLHIYKPYVNGFKSKKTRVCLYENFGGFWVEQEQELQEKINEFEQEYNAVVYAVTHEFTEFGELYDFLVVTDYEEEWETLVEKSYEKENGIYYVFGYTWNKDNEDFSEFGTFAVKSFGGGIKRVS